MLLGHETTGKAFCCFFPQISALPAVYRTSLRENLCLGDNFGISSTLQACEVENVIIPFFR